MQIRQCYIKLDTLYARSKRAEDSMDIKSIDEIHNEYSDVLLNTENHIDFTTYVLDIQKGMTVD